MAGEDGEVEFTPLTHALLCESLSKIEMVVEGGGFAFTKLVCSDKELTHLGNLGTTDEYKQLKHVVLSNNKLSDISQLTQLPHLLTLQLENNQVQSLDCLQEANLPWCQKLNLSSNKLTSLPPLGVLQRLRSANFGSNEIESLAGFGAHPVLQELDLQENKLASLEGLGTLACLKRLVLAGNALTSLAGLDAPQLERLEAGRNQLASLEHVAGAPRCLVLDVSENQFTSDDFMLPELRRLGADTPKLQELRLAGNPLADGFGETLKVEALVCAPQLLRVDEEELTDEDREAAKQREQELEEAAKQREEERQAELAAKAEEEAAAAAAAAAEGEEGA